MYSLQKRRHRINKELRQCDLLASPLGINVRSSASRIKEQSNRAYDDSFDYGGASFFDDNNSIAFMSSPTQYTKSITRSSKIRPFTATNVTMRTISRPNISTQLLQKRLEKSMITKESLDAIVFQEAKLLHFKIHTCIDEANKFAAATSNPLRYVLDEDSDNDRINTVMNSTRKTLSCPIPIGIAKKIEKTMIRVEDCSNNNGMVRMLTIDHFFDEHKQLHNKTKKITSLQTSTNSGSGITYADDRITDDIEPIDNCTSIPSLTTDEVTKRLETILTSKVLQRKYMENAYDSIKSRGWNA